MPNTTFTFNKENFTESHPSFDPNGEYDKSLRFNSVTKTLQLNSTDAKNHSFSFSIPSGDYDFGVITFDTPNKSDIGVKASGDRYWARQVRATNVYFIFKDENGTNTDNDSFRVITNADPDLKTSLLNITISLGHKKRKPSSNTTLTLNYTCDVNTVYEYEAGLHVYSPYDARDGQSTLRTKIYSLVPISSWNTSTYIYSDPFLSRPALPYWYGIGDKVYRSGTEWSRSRGTKIYYETRKKRFRKAKTKLHEIGPIETYNSSDLTSEACIEPVMGKVGTIQKISSTGSLDAPQQYRYYLGYGGLDKKASNDNFFKALSYEKNKSYPITGYQHVINKLPKGIINSDEALEEINPTGVFIVSNIAMWAYIGHKSGWFTNWGTDYFGKWVWDSGKGKMVPMTKIFGTGGFAKFLGILAKVIWYAAIIAIIVGLFLLLFKRYTVKYQEECPRFHHRFASTPYLNTGNTIYSNKEQSQISSGWHCDGAYFYYQGSSITSKLLSNTYAFIHDDPFKQENLDSVKPDQETLVEDYGRLMLLSYISGKPEPYYGGNQIYYSEEFSQLVTSNSGDLQHPISELVVLPASASTSNINVQSANTEAEQEFSASLKRIQNSIDVAHGVKIDDSFIGELDADFTHELKHENTPKQVTLFYDNRSGSLSTGTPVYYDPQGHQKALSGYYAAEHDSYYRVFYKVDKGYITNIDYSSTVVSTTSVNGNPITTTNLDYTSNWYLKSDIENILYVKARSLDLPTFEPNTLYSSSENNLIAGFHKSSSLDDFQVYTYNTSTGVVNTSSYLEAESGYYLQLNDWLDPEDVFLYQDTLIAFTSSIRGTTADEVCPFTVSHLSQSYYHNGDAGQLPAEGDRVYLSTGSDYSNNRLTSGYYMIASSSIMVVDGNGIVNNIRTCTADESISSGNDVDPILLRYNTSTNTNYACTSSQQTFYISGSFTGTLHGIWANSAGTIRANSGSYSNGTVYRSYVKGLGDDWLIGTTQSCSGGGSNTVLSSSLLAPGFTENGACGNDIYVRYWWEGGSAWYNSSDLYQSTSSNGEGQTQASNAYYSDGLTVNQYTNSSWGNAGLCSGGGPI